MRSGEGGMSDDQGRRPVTVTLECGCTLTDAESHGEGIYIGGKVVCPNCRASFRVTGILWPDGQPVTPWADPWHDVAGDIRSLFREQGGQL
jgi:hypothetical protein